MTTNSIGSIPRDDLALAAMHRHRSQVSRFTRAAHQDRRPARLDRAATAAARARARERHPAHARERLGASVLVRRPAAARRAPSPSPPRGVRLHRLRPTRTAAGAAPGSRCSRRSPRRPPSPHVADRDAAKGRDRHIERHAHAANGTPHHHALAMQLDVPRPLVGSCVARRETHRQGKRVEPQRAARPGGASATSSFDASNSPTPDLLPGRRRSIAQFAPESA